MNLPVRNPRTGLIDYEIAVTAAERIATIARERRQAQPQWQQRGLAGRIAVLQKFSAALDAHRASGTRRVAEKHRPLVQ